MKSLRLSVFAVALVLAGCTASPTDAPLRDHAAPSLDSSAADGESVMSAGTTNGDSGIPAAPPATSNDSTTTGRGGNTTGSGN